MKCKWCSKQFHYVAKHDGLCEVCVQRYIEKRDFVAQKKELPPDDTTDEEIWALCFPLDPHAQEIMTARIARVTKQIQDNWTEEQRLSRAIQKKTTPVVSKKSVRWAKAKVTSIPSSRLLRTSGTTE